MGSFFPISKTARVIPAQGLSLFTSRSASSTALPVEGAGVATDSVTQQTSSTASGVFMFDTSESTGLELAFVLTDTAAQTATFRVFRELVYGSEATNEVTAVTYRHVCDISVTACSAKAGIVAGIINSSLLWGIPTVTSDAGLAPNGTRVLQGSTAGAPGTVVIDPLCAGRVMVVGKKGTCTDFAVVANKWTGM